MPIAPRSQVINLPLEVHGTPDPVELRALGVQPADLLDFSSNLNAYGPSPTVRDAVARTPLDRYPDREALSLRGALAEHLGVSPECILAANGCSELIWLTCLSFLRELDRVLVFGPTFGEYARMAAIMGADLRIHLAQEDNGFALPASQIRNVLCSLCPRLVFLCNPNNPTGTFSDSNVIVQLAHSYPKTLFIVDESYLTFAPNLGTAIDSSIDNVLVLRSMTKDFGLAGLRLGYAVGARELIECLSRVRPPWSVNAVAQAAGIAALRDQEHLRRSLELLAAAKGRLMTALRELGIQVLPSAAPFFLVRVGNGAAVRLKLLRKGILVRDCASFGLPHHIRICTRRPDENARLVAALHEVMHAG